MNMEIPEIKMISDFECMENPTLISRFFSLSGIENVPQVFSFWKWGAVILLLFATLRILIKGIKLIFIHFNSLIKHSPHLSVGTGDFEFSESDDCSSISSVEEEEENIQTTSFSDQRKINEEFCVKGWQNGNLRHRRRWSSSGERFAWSEFTSGKNIVKLWDSLGLGMNFVEDNDNINSKSIVSISLFIIVYDVTRRKTFTNLLKIWAKELELYSTNPDCVKMLVGNKVDRDSERAVTVEEGMALAQKHKCLFLECNARTRENVQQLFQDFKLSQQKF